MMNIRAGSVFQCSTCRTNSLRTNRVRHGIRFLRVQCSAQQNDATLRDPDTTKLVEWSRGVGIKFPSVTPANFGDGLRGLMSLKSIRYGDVICSVPNKQALLATDAEKSPFSDFIKPEFWDSAPLNVRLALKLLYERQQGDKSKYATWIQNLPQQIELLVEWEQETLGVLQYPYLEKKAQSVRADWQQWHERVQAALLGGNSVTWQQWLWALACVRTRTFYGPWFATSTRDKVLGALGALAVAGAVATQSVEAGIGAFTVGAAVVTSLIFWELDQAKQVKRLAFLPFLDLLNHSYLANKSVCYYDWGSSSHIVKSLRDYEEGEQVFMSYGRMSNDEALLYYGFMEADNDADEYVLTRLLQWLRQYQPIDEARVKALAAANMLGVVEQVKISARGELSSQVVDSVRYLLADEDAAAAGPKALKQATTAALEAKVQEALASVVRSELEALPTSVKTDFESVQGQYIPKYKQISGVGEGYARIATLFRIEKKKILFRCLEKLSTAAPSAQSTQELVAS